MNTKFQIKTCPTCGSNKIRRVVKDVVRKYKDQTYKVPAIEFYECSNCGEKVYDKVAIQKIEEHSPAYRPERAFVKAYKSTRIVVPRKQRQLAVKKPANTA